MDFSMDDDDIDAAIMKVKVDYAESNHSDPEPEPSDGSDNDDDDDDEPFDVYSYVETQMMNEFSECESDTNSGGAEVDATTKGSKQRFECMECEDVFDTRDDLIKHMDEHFDSGTFSTDLAIERYKKNREKNNKLSKPMKNFHCPLCSYKCVKKRRLEDHMVVHSDEKPFSCTHCDFKTKHQLSLKTHTKKKHGGKESQACVIGELRRIQPKLKPKIETLLNGQIYTCTEPDCNFVTKNVNEITEHMDTHDELQTGISPGETGEQPDDGEDEEWEESEEEEYITARNYNYRKIFKCKYHNCGYTVTRKEAFQLHLMRHKGKRPPLHQCKRCDFQCTLKDGLNKHMQSHTKKHKCLLCDYRCANRPTLNKHILRHTGEKPFACDWCDYRATSKGLIRAHVVVHSTIKKHECLYCSFATNRKQELLRHVERIHIKEKPYICEFCPYASSQRSELNKHVKLKHNEFKPAQIRPQVPRKPRRPRQPKMESKIVTQESVLPHPGSFSQILETIPPPMVQMPPRGPRQLKMESNILAPEAGLPQQGSFAQMLDSMPPTMVQMPHMSFHGGYQFPHNGHGHYYGHN
ncbi:unnamed protein product [Meganyctiphanes norvegica]|uniref:C2H2-type domain-containing protein n=1 Tax=Meganyctiphanes norvegica TaxID=48144 RepID=A0AAV2SCM4_MEGNR